MNQKERLELANWAIGQARKNGADQVGVDLSRMRDVQVGFRGGKIEQLQESIQSYLNMSIYANNRYSSHSTNDIRKSALDKFIGEAVAMTKYLNQDSFRSLPDPKFYTNMKDVDLHINDPDYNKITSKERVNITRQMQETASAQSDKIISCTSGYNDTYYESVKVNSNGFQGNVKSTSFSIGVDVTVNDKNGGRPEDWEWATTCFYKDLPSPQVLVKTAANRALRKIGQTKLDSGLYDMVAENRVGDRLLYSLYSAMQSSAIQQKSSFLEGKLGQKIASDKLTLIDDPFIRSGLGSTLFDNEGIVSKRRTMIDQGVLKEYYIDSYYGKKLGMQPTSGSATNIILGLGDKSLNDIIKQVKKGILINMFIGGNFNSTTGDFSYGIIGMYIENGAIVKPVHEMNISGNLIELWGKLDQVGADPYIYSSWQTPSLLFRDIQFSGV